MDLATYRKSLGLSQGQFAPTVGLRNKGSVSKIEGGEPAAPLVALRIQKVSGGLVPAIVLCPALAGLIPDVRDQAAADGQAAT